MDKIDSNILIYYLNNVRGFLHGQKKVQTFPGIEKNIENILVEIAVHHTYPCENLDDVSKIILEDIKTELIKNQNQFELICTFQEMECGTRSLIYTKNKVNTMKEMSPMRQPLSMKGPLPMQPLRKPNIMSSKNETPSSLINSAFKLRCLNATLKFVKDESTLTLRYPDMASEQADFIVNMFQQRNVDSNIGLGYKTMYAPLWEAMKIFGLKYKFTLRHVEAKSSDMKCLILDKLPIISKSDKTNQDQQTDTQASIILTYSTDNLQKTSKNDTIVINKQINSKNDGKTLNNDTNGIKKQINSKNDEKTSNNDTNGINKQINSKNDLKTCNSLSSDEYLNAINDKTTPKIRDVVTHLGPTYITEMLNKIFNFVTDKQSVSLIIDSLTIQEVHLVKNFKQLCSRTKYIKYLNEHSKILARKITEKIDEKSFRINIKIDKLGIKENGKIIKCKKLKDTLTQTVTLWKVPVTSSKRANNVSSPTSIDSSNSSSSILSSNSTTSKQSLNSLSSINSQFASALNLNDNETPIKPLGTSIKSVATPSNINTKPSTTKNNKKNTNPNNIIIIPTVTSSNSTTNVANNDNTKLKQETTSSNTKSNINTKPDTSNITSSNNTKPKQQYIFTSRTQENTKDLVFVFEGTKPVTSNTNNNNIKPTTSNKSVTNNNNITMIQESTSSNSNTSVANNNNSNTKAKQDISASTSSTSVASSNIKKPPITSSNSTTSVASTDTKKPPTTSSSSSTSVASANNTKPGTSSSNSAISVASGNKLNKTQQKLLEGLNQPVVSDKATKIMLNMGWSGGGLGAREEGITTPLAPGIDYFFENKPRLGLGGLEIIEQIRAQKQQQKTKRPQPQQLLNKREYHIISLETILRLLINNEYYQQIELPQSVLEREWGFVKHLVTCFNTGTRQGLYDERQIELVNFINCIMASGTWRLSAEAFLNPSIIIVYKQQFGPLPNNIKIEGDVITINTLDGRNLRKIILNNYDYNPNNIRITINNNAILNDIKTDGDSIKTYSNDSKSMKKIPVKNNKKQSPPPLKPIMLKSEGKDKADFQNYTNLNNLTKKDQKQLIPIIPNAPETKSSMNNQNNSLKNPSEKSNNTCASVPFSLKTHFLAHVLVFCKEEEELKTMKFTYDLSENEKEYIVTTIKMINKEEKCMESGLEARFHEKIHNAINGFTVKGDFTSNHSITLKKRFNYKAEILMKHNKGNQNNNTQNNNCKSIINNNINNSSQATNNSQVAKPSKATSGRAITKKDQEVDIDLETSELIRRVKRVNNDIDELIDNTQIASSSSQVVNKSSQVVNKSSQDLNTSSQVVNNTDPFIDDIDKNIDDIPVVIVSDEEEYLLLSDDGLARELQELRDLYKDEKNNVTKIENTKHESKSTENIPKNVKIENTKREFVKEPSPGKRSRSNSETLSQESKKSKLYAKKIAIVPKNYPEETITQQTAREIQILIKDSIDNFDCCPNLELPLLQCNGLENGVLLYCCFTEKSFYFVEDLLRNSDFKINHGMTTDSPGIRMTLRITSFFVENTELTLKRLAKYNKGLCTRDWKVIKRLFSKDCDLFLIEIDEDSYNFIREENFSLFAGVDKVLFNHYDED